MTHINDDKNLCEVCEKSFKRSFYKDLAMSNQESIRKDFVKILKKIFGQQTEITFKDDLKVQKDFGIDTIVQLSNGRRFSIELKTISYKYRNTNQYPLELISHVYEDEDQTILKYSKAGWLYTTTAEYILYGVRSEDDKRIISFCCCSIVPFKLDNFKTIISKLPIRFCDTKDNNQTTIFCLADKSFLKQYAKEFWCFKLGGNIDDYLSIS